MAGPRAREARAVFMLLVAGALAQDAEWTPAPQGACPAGYTAEKTTSIDYNEVRCVNGTSGPLFPESDADLNSSALLCQPTRAGFGCCFAQYGTVTNAQTGTEDVQRVEYRCSTFPKGHTQLEHVSLFPSQYDNVTYCQSTEPGTHPPLSIAGQTQARTVSVWCGNSDADSGLSPGAIAGIAVGAVAFVAIAAVVVLF